ncbi:hypothetical protein ACWDY7_32245 [Streptomyces calvus]|uniref:Uncharacterized protein n=1 Tax=Streptomyces calvus TaxID=67282 RepID=A0AA40SKI9_9ACTN|nr:hypothetical protein [Streptomyces calvus]MBA8948186.1 hypothetical protein [Streptomyces calvus]GGP84036.1 hypothetical protein GCM10010247_66750 [Streptomyces calvus]
MADDDRGADVLTLPTFNLSPPGSTPDDDDVPGLPEPPSTAPPPDFSLPFHVPDGEEDGSDHDPDNVAGEMIANAVSGTGTPARATASMAMVTMAAIAVAAMRGTWSMAAYLKARREHHDAVADKAREAADKQKVANAEKGAKNRVQPGPEFGRGAAKGGGRGAGGGSGSGSGGGGRGTFGQKGAAKGSTGNASAGAGGRGTGAKGPKGSGSANGSVGGRRGSNNSGSSGSGSTSPGSKGSKGSTGSSDRSGSRGSGGSSSKKPGTLGQMALNRQKRKADEAKAQRQAAADERKADLADRAAARKQAEKDADARRQRKAERRKAKLERAKAGGSDKGSKKDDKAKAGKDDAEKVDLKKKPKADDKGDGDGTSTTPKTSTSGTAKRRKARWRKRPWKRRSARRKPGDGAPGGKQRRTSRTGRSGPSESVGSMPGGDGEWLKPPPGWDVSYSVTIEREPARSRPSVRRPAEIGTGQKGLPAGKGGEVTPTRTEPKESPIVMGTAAAVGEIGDTQFVDADLTVYDLIDSDEEMGEQILAGVDHMRLVASKCDGLKNGLENLYATCVEKKVPGVLVKWCIRLMERAGSVQDKAEALAESLPRASEAILTARDTAIEADKRRADAVKDAGHVAPAAREYHDRSGV